MQQVLGDIDRVRAIVVKHGRLSANAATLANDSDLYNAGLTSLATVGIMLALEDQFEIEFPESMLKRKTFESIESIAEAVAELLN
jgi:acyl carrier protein